MQRLKTIYEDIELYHAGFPHFPRNFTRDSIIAGILMQNTDMLKSQLSFAAKKQGTKSDPQTGEEFGKIFHEFPGYTIDNLSTLYNACDTTALFLIGHDYYFALTGDNTLKEEQKQQILNAVGYIQTHLKDYMFYEDPRLSGAERFALKVTYWKDSALIGRENGTPEYPVNYFLAHVINLAGIRSAAKIVNNPELVILAQNMQQQIKKFFDVVHRKVYIAIDTQGPIEGTSSDILHALFYLQPGDLSLEELMLIEQLSQELETPIGYVTLAQTLVHAVNDSYHSTTVWPFEQAMINIGAKKFNLIKVEEVSRRVTSHLDSDPEIFIRDKTEFKKSGCDPQLWTIAAKKHFSERVNVPIPVIVPA